MEDINRIKVVLVEKKKTNKWLAQEMGEDDILAVDGRLFSINNANVLEEFCGKNGFRFAADFAPADTIWADREPRPMGKAFIHEEKYAGESVLLAKPEKTAKKKAA